MKYLFVITAILFINLTQIYSQLKEGNNLAGVTLCYSPKLQNVIFGANYEYELPSAGIGVFGIGAVTRFWIHSEDILDNSAKLRNTNIAIGGKVNYNFKEISDGKFIPFAGFRAGYNNVSTKYTHLAGSSNNGKNTGNSKADCS
ncbi:MAG: hypothetical protein ABI543_05580 [Ignavibacteria bacterium]